MGLMQCDDDPRGFTAGTRWSKIDERMADTNCNILDTIEQTTGL